MSNVYYTPEEFGLRVVAEIEYSTGAYEFDTRVVWADENGKLYTARDSGCSCPTPFEDLASLEDLEDVVLAALRDEVDAYHTDTTAEERLNFKNTVAAALMDPASVAFEPAEYQARKAAAQRKVELIAALKECREQLRVIFPKMPGYSSADLPSMVPEGLQAHDAMVLGTYLQSVAHAAIQQGAEEDAERARQKAAKAEADAALLRLPLAEENRTAALAWQKAQSA